MITLSFCKCRDPFGILFNQVTDFGFNEFMHGDRDGLC